MCPAAAAVVARAHRRRMKELQVSCQSLTTQQVHKVLGLDLDLSVANRKVRLLIFY